VLFRSKHIATRTLRDGSPSNVVEIVGNPKPRVRRKTHQEEAWSKKVKETSKRRFAVSKAKTLEKVDRFFDENDVSPTVRTGVRSALAGRRRKP
jgi:hypothetical protein